MRFVGVRIVGMNTFEVMTQSDIGEYVVFRVADGAWEHEKMYDAELLHFAKQCFIAWNDGKSLSRRGTDMA